MIELDIMISSIGAILMYNDIGRYYIINHSLAGYLGSWKRDLRRLVS